MPYTGKEGERFVLQPEEGTISICAHCFWKHLGSATCAAYPEGIPDEILFSEVDHRLPYAGDRGIQYKPEKET